MDLCILKHFICGNGIITFGFPPNLGFLAYISPIVRETVKAPGYTKFTPYDLNFLFILGTLRS